MKTQEHITDVVLVPLLAICKPRHWKTSAMELELELELELILQTSLIPVP